jgi:nucleotidyltransferase AbiEii toxin of type IV toxin-antitoxin system
VTRESFDDLEKIGAVSEALSDLGLMPVLVGGMALVILGSRRVTRDFDFVIARPDDRLNDVIAVLYDRGLELASRVNNAGDVVATIDNRKVAASRLRIDAPWSAYFFNPATRLRIDLLFDFPIPAAELMKTATTMKIRSQVLRVASEDNLLRLKRLAKAGRSSPGDAQDIAFLEARRRPSR